MLRAFVLTLGTRIPAMTLVHVFDVPDESEHLQRSDEAKVWKVDTSGSVGERGEQVMVVVDGLADDEGVRPCEALRYTGKRAHSQQACRG